MTEHMFFIYRNSQVQSPDSATDSIEIKSSQVEGDAVHLKYVVGQDSNGRKGQGGNFEHS